MSDNQSQGVYFKFTEGYVKQTFNKEGLCIAQEFHAGDPVEHEDANGDNLDYDTIDKLEYQPFDMVQPIQSDNDSLCLIHTSISNPEATTAEIEAIVQEQNRRLERQAEDAEWQRLHNAGLL